MTVNRKNYLIAWGILLSAGIVWSIAYWHTLDHLPDTYSGEAVSGRVVDAQTGKPIAGAIVIGINELSAPYGMEGHIIAGNMHAEEVLTDEDGNYQLAAWGPKPRDGKTFLNHPGPKILVYKNGYELYEYISFSRDDDRFNPVQTSIKTGSTIELKRFEGDLAAYARHLSGLTIPLASVLEPVFGATGCDWILVPRIMIELDRLKWVGSEKGIDTRNIPGLDELLAVGNCGTRDEFIRRYANDIKDDTDRSGGTDN